jgi:hypothetical protein
MFHRAAAAYHGVSCPRMRVVLPCSVVSALREHQARSGWVDEVTQSQDAFVLFGGMGSPLYVTSRGLFLVGADEGDSFLYREATEDEAVSALVIGAARTGVVGLLALAPEVPTHANECSFCGGSRWHPIKSVEGEWPIVICPQCYGRGWVS